MVVAAQGEGRRRAVEMLADELNLHPISVYRMLREGRLPDAYRDAEGIWRQPEHGRVLARGVRGLLVRGGGQAKSQRQVRAELRRAVRQTDRLTRRLNELLETLG
jgi:hypothetical protein